MKVKQNSRLIHFEVILRLFFKIIILNFNCEKNPLIALRNTFKIIMKMRRASHTPIKKFFRINGHYYWDLNLPGYPSPAFDQILSKEISGLNGSSFSPLVFAIVAMTKKCGLNCQHCFEWDSINQKEELSFSDLKIIIEKLLAQKVGQIVFSGGDPLNRIEVLIRLLETFKDRPVDFWINTSGYNMNFEKANQLKQAGLTGVVFSLDHYIPEFHDHFRGVSGCFEKVVSGVDYAEKTGLISALSLCATKEFLSAENLNQYLRFAQKIGINFIQILEPKPVGRYATARPQLNQEEKELLANFFEYSSKLKNSPIISYPDYNRRRFGCIGGKKYVYVDTAGNFNPCPFCSNKLKNELPFESPSAIRHCSQQD